MSWRFQLLARSHRREGFDCGEVELNDFLHRFARQNDAKDISRTYVLLEDDQPDVVGYYTLCSGSVAFKVMPDQKTRKLPHYPIPTAHIARLAVDRHRQGEKLGALLLSDAIKRILAVAEQMGIHAITVQAMHAKAAGFYKAFGFQPFRDDPLHLFLPIATAQKC